MIKKASLWDIPRPDLDPTVWGSDLKLLPQHKVFILDKVKRVMEGQGYMEYDQWVEGIFLLGSIASYQYNPRSDVDVHLVVDVQKMIELDYKNAVDQEQAVEILDRLRKEVNTKDVEMVPGTQHPIEMTFHYKGVESSPVMPSNVGLYDVVKDVWVREPNKTDLSKVVEKVYPDLIQTVMDFAAKYEVQVVKLRKDVVDVEYFVEALSQFPDKFRAVLSAEIEKKLEDINLQIDDYVARTTELIERRHQQPYLGPDQLPAELQQKYLARYGYLWLNKQLKELTEHKDVVEEDLPELEQKLKEVPKLSKKLPLGD